MSYFFSSVISGEVSQIACPVDHKVPIAVDKNKIFLPWETTSTISCGGFLTTVHASCCWTWIR